MNSIVKTAKLTILASGTLFAAQRKAIGANRSFATLLFIRRGVVVDLHG